MSHRWKGDRRRPGETEGDRGAGATRGKPRETRGPAVKRVDVQLYPNSASIIPCFTLQNARRYLLVNGTVGIPGNPSEAVDRVRISFDDGSTETELYDEDDVVGLVEASWNMASLAVGTYVVKFEATSGSATSLLRANITLAAATQWVPAGLVPELRRLERHRYRRQVQDQP